jgi:hypothetical protein
MTGDRFIFLIVCSIISCLPSSSWVTELKASKANLVVEPTVTSSNQVQLQADLLFDFNWTLKNNAADRDGIVKLRTLELSGKLLNLQGDVFGHTITLISDRAIKDNSLDNTAVEESSRISKRWSLFGMAITFLGSLILLRLLFIPSSKKVSPTSDKSAVKQRVSKVIEHEARLNNEDLEPLRYFPDDLEDISKLEIISKDRTMSAKRLSNGSSNGDRYLNKTLSKNFELTNRLTILNSNTSEIDVVLELIKNLQQPDHDLRREAIWGLAEVGDSRGIEPLVRILSQVSSSDRGLILDAIAQITQRSFKPINVHFLATLDDASPEIKQNTIRDLAALYEFVAPISKQIARMQVDRDVRVQQTAKVAIERLNLCYFPCLFDDCPNAGDRDANSKNNSDRTNHTNS